MLPRRYSQGARQASRQDVRQHTEDDLAQRWKICDNDSDTNFVDGAYAQIDSVPIRLFRTKELICGGDLGDGDTRASVPSQLFFSTLERYETLHKRHQEHDPNTPLGLFGNLHVSQVHDRSGRIYLSSISL